MGMKIVDKQRLMGNYAEAHVSRLLASGGCFVRPVSAGTDVGIDLYCETTVPAPELEEGSTTPFLHFWVQVKAGAQCKPAGDQAKFHFSKKELDYWYRQPIPVFAALVPMDWPPNGAATVYIVDVGTELVWAGSPQSGRTLTSGLALAPNDHEVLEFLLREHLPSATAIIDCKRGVVGNRPTLSPQYVGRTPLMPAAEYSPRITYQIRITSANSVISMWRRGQLLDPNMVGNRRVLASIARVFIEAAGDRHWETYFASALSLHADGNFDEATRHYKDAAEIIKADSRIDPTSDPWQRHLDEIAVNLNAATCREPLAPHQ